MKIYLSLLTLMVFAPFKTSFAAGNTLDAGILASTLGGCPTLDLATLPYTPHQFVSFGNSFSYVRTSRGAWGDSSKMVLLPYGKNVLKASNGGLQIIDPVSNKKIAELPKIAGGNLELIDIEFLQNGNIGIGSRVGSIYVWNPKDNSVVISNGNAKGAWNKVLWNIQSTRSGAIASSDSTTVKIFDPVTAKFITELKTKREGDFARSMTVNRDGDVVVKTWDTIEVFDGSTYKLKKVFKFTNDTQQHPTALIPLSDGRILEQDYYGSVRIWDLKYTSLISKTIAPQVKLENGFPNWVNEIAEHSDANLIMGRSTTRGDSTSIYFWDTKSGKLVGTIEEPAPNEKATVQSLLALPNRRMATFHADGRVRIWDLSTFKMVQEVTSNPLSVFAQSTP